MKVQVLGGDNNLVFTEARALCIYNNKGELVVIYRFPVGSDSYIRYSKGEDENFNDVARQLEQI